MTSESTPTAGSFDLPLLPTDFDELDSILDDLRTRFDETPQWEFCEGFMVALICCRRVISPQEYFSVLLDLEVGADPLLFASEAQFDRFTQLWLRRWVEIATALDIAIEDLNDERAYQPEMMDMHGALAVLSADERAAMGDAPVPSFGQVWAIGFMFGVESWPEEWAAPHDNDAQGVLNSALECIVALTEDDTEPPTVAAFTNDAGEEGVPSMSEQRLDDLTDALWAVYDLRELWRNVGPRIEPVHVGPKVGRNDPCPCGSGKKYKKCCGAQ